MRKLFVQKLVEFAEQDPNVFLLAGDLGFSVIEPFKEKFQDRFINAGIAEQNMIGVAAGLALTGKKVFVYTIIPFLTMRCFEQIRVDLCYQNLPVVLVGVGAGFAYGSLGATHHSIEDIAIMRALPNMAVIVPGSNLELNSLMNEIKTISGPVYLRLSKNEQNIVYPQNIKIKMNHGVEIIPSDFNLILASGDIVSVAFDVCIKLRNLGIDIGLYSIPTIKPLNCDFILSRKNTLKSVFTIEDHSWIGGLGEMVFSFVGQIFENKILVKNFSIPDKYFCNIGSRDYLRNKAGLSVENISAEILSVTKFNGSFVNEHGCNQKKI